MKRKRIFIFDSSIGIAQFFKRDLSKDYSVDLFFKFQRNLIESFENYDLALFFVNEPIELLDLMCVYKKNTPILVGSRCKEIDRKICDFEGVIYFDYAQNKYEILDFVRFNLEGFEKLIV